MRPVRGLHSEYLSKVSSFIPAGPSLISAVSVSVCKTSSSPLTTTDYANH
jgi:hypothetical protein